MIVFGKFTICSQFCCSQKIYRKFTICSKTGSAARSRNLQKIYNLFTIFFTNCLQKIYGLFTISGTQDVHNSFTIWTRKVYKLFTISLKRVAAWESDTMKYRGYLCVRLNFSLTCLRNYPIEGGGFRDFSGEIWKIVFLTNIQS